MLNRRLISSAVLCLVLFQSYSAHAIIEIRGLLGVNTVSGSGADGQPSDLKPVALFGFGVDGIVTPPLIPIGFGLRYETLSQKMSATVTGISQEATTTFNRLALVVNMRLIDTGIYLGPIVTYGISNTLKYDLVALGTTYKVVGKDVSSYSLGVEGGLKLIGWLVGAELGFNSLKAGNYEFEGVLQNEKVDFSGMYARAVVGFGF